MARPLWFVYILRCANGALYTGITTEVARRLGEHNAGKGARYTRAFGPARLLWSEPAGGRSEALRREAAIKRLSREEKLALARASRKAARVARGRIRLATRKERI